MPTASPARSTRSSSRQSGGSTPGRNASTPGGRSRATPRRRIAANADTPERSSVRNGDSRPGSQTPRGSQTPSRMIGSDPDVVPPSVPDEEIVVAQGLSSLALSEIDLSSPLNYGSDIGPGSRNTPIRPRPDVRVDRRMRQVNLGSVGDAALDASLGSNVASDGAGAPQLVIWGTDVVVTTSKAKFTQFLNTYTEEDLAEDEQVAGLDMARPYYLQRLEEIQVLEEPFLNLNCSHLRTFDTDLYRQLVNYPQEVIPIFDMATNELFFELYPETNLQHQIQVRPFNAEQTKNMRLLNPEDIDQLVTITGMVIRSSNLIPEMREAFFKCSICRTTRTVELDRGRIEEPVLCTNCNTNHTFSIQHNRSAFTDKQMVKLQESPEDMPAGQTPHTVILFAYNDMVDDVQPGDRVAVTGIYRATPVRSNPRQRSVKAVYKTHIDVVHFRKMDQKRLREENVHSISYFSEERVGFLRELSKKPDIYERLARAIAPSIYEHQDIKKGILLQLFGGTRKEFENTSHGRFRSEINILLCGDPGTSKSQLLQYVFNLVPRSQYTSGKGSSAVGLTAYVVRDPETKQLVMQTGALVLADNGVCCIDEFDKMSETTRSILHEVMENQTLSIAKAGIICQLNARTSVLAAANPCESQWNPNKTIVENIQLPHTLLSRFDLIFLMLDPQDEAYDRKLGRHLVSLYHRTRESEQDELLDMTILRDYIAYAKEHIHPKLSEEASQKLISTYVDMRKAGSGRGVITAYPRQLESMIRLGEAHAKMRYSEVVEIRDVDEAHRLYREALKQSATDPLSGKIDVGILATGLSVASRKQRTELAACLRRMLEKRRAGTTLNQQRLLMELRAASEVSVTREMFEDVLRQLQDDDCITITGKSIRLHPSIVASSSAASA